LACWVDGRRDLTDVKGIIDSYELDSQPKSRPQAGDTDKKDPSGPVRVATSAESTTNIPWLVGISCCPGSLPGDDPPTCNSS